MKEEASLKWAQSQLPFIPVFLFISYQTSISLDFKGEQMGLSNCFFVFSKQHICNHLLPSPIRFNDKSSLGRCFPPSRTGKGGNSTSYLGGVRGKWRRSQCCTQPWAAAEICMCSQGFKSKQLFLCLDPLCTREGGRRSSATAWWRRMSEPSTQEW